ncbi:uncharacterized protein VICG_01285 [Vittaforma corneae ATCC 50505]|uniref:Cyclin N-terminal domain-containing protein n=1 Tax=Vittaforma corneae (strain ATCC 50505) TaxID=993615 RepID=L2GMX6_VITCO|nr:uncharacterized protein VICG_01285 [Vittaforma corneae ATCC 50505]ELA41652.1 hypothetical protein VICG_01285 [Vittaforma corneae ATCC 50505]
MEKSSTAEVKQGDISKRMHDGNSVILEICNKLKLPRPIRAMSQGIFQKCINFDVNLRRLCHTCVFLSSKIVEHPISPSLFKSVTKSTIDTELELKIAEELQFEFDILDVYAFVENIAAMLKIEGSLPARMGELDSIFSDGRITYFSPFGGEHELSYLGLSLFTDKQLKIFETLNCIVIDKQKIKDIRQAAMSVQ